MAINVRFIDGNEDKAKELSDREGTSINNIINKAVAEYYERHNHNAVVDEILGTEMERWAGLLERLK
ncbi:hypothetical protein AB0N05_16395 [Nocardia sp. NPDC051030]|uniref:hypothetical protein n=1 Tax=Nocardia sp. NPDC051030 TaxID=3155162 RepID=UPI0034147718